MSTTNNNPFLLNIIPTENTITAASGLDVFATLRTDVTNIQQMVIFDEKRIAVDTINAFNNTQVEIINNVNIGSSQTNNVPDAELTVNGIPVGGSVDITTITTNITNISRTVSSLSSVVNNIVMGEYGGGLNYGVSSLSSIISYGLSSLGGATGNKISSLSSIVSYGLSSLGGAAGNGVSSLSSIVSYGLSSLGGAAGNGVSSLSSIVSYSLSSVYSPYGISSLSSLVSYGLSSVAAQPHYGVSSLSSLISYGLSSLYFPDGISSLSSLVSYGLSSLYSSDGISSLSSIVSYGLSSVYSPYGISSLSSIMSYGLSSVWSDLALSNNIITSNFLSLSTIISYGLSSVNITTIGGTYDNTQITNTGILYFSNAIFSNTTINNISNIYYDSNFAGISSLSSIVSYGLSTVYSPYGLSSLSSIVSYGLSSLGGATGTGVSSLSSIVSYGLSSLGGAAGTGVSSLSSIISYGLSSLGGAAGTGVSSLSSIISYGLSSVYSPYGVSSLSSIISYGLSTVYSPYGISSLSSIVSYGLSSVYSPYGISSLSSIVSYGLSSVYSPYGLSSLSSIVSYGLSTVYSNINVRLSNLEASNDYLKYNTWDVPFRPSTIGGTDIYDLSTGNPDTYTDALAKIDAWIYKNIIDQPPPPKYNSQSNSISSLSFYWKSPDQFKIGLLNIYSPYISSIHFELYSNVSATSNLFSTFVFSDGLVPFNRFQVEAVEFTNSEPSIFQFNNANNTVKIGIDSRDFNAINGPYNLNMYFRNYSSNIYSTLSFNSQNMGIVSPPSAPQSIVINNITLFDANIVIQKPLYNASNLLTETYPDLNNYKVILSNTSDRPRSYAANAVSATLVSNYIFPYSSDFQINTFGSVLTPDLNYFVTVSARNSLNVNYGATIVSSNFRAARPEQPGTISNICNAPTNTTYLYPRSGQNIFSLGAQGISSNLTIYNRNLFGAVATPLSLYTNSNLGIHSILNTGSSNNNICALSVSIDNIETVVVNIPGFNPIGTYNPISNAGTRLITTVDTIRDFYFGDAIRNDFYLSFTGYTYLQSSYLTPRSNPYSVVFRHSNTFFNTTLSNTSINIDGINSAPSINNIVIPTGTSALYNYISGVPVYSYSNTLALGFIINNLASNFYISGQKLIVGSLLFGVTNLGTNFSVDTTAPILTPNGASVILSTPLPVQVRINIANNSFNNATLYTPATSGGIRLNAQVTLSNLVNSNTGVARIPAYFDAKSEIVVKTIVNSAINGTGGLQMASDLGLTTNIPSGIYDHSQSLKASPATNYNSELPIINGLFQTSAILSNSYNSFTDFSSPSNANPYPTTYGNINSESGEPSYIRYATFKYSFTNTTTTSNIHKIQFNLSNLTGLLCNTGVNPYNTGSVSILHYRVDNVGLYNTPWLNGNTTRSIINAFTPTVSLLAPGVRSNDLTYAPITNSSRFFSVIPILPNCNFDLYVRIGLNMAAAISFQNIYMIPYYGIVPSAPLNVDLSLVGTNLQLTWQAPTNTNPPLANYIFSITPSNDPIYPRRYIVGGGPTIIQESYFLNNTVGPQITSYVNQFSNYDTFYSASVALENDVGTGTYGTDDMIQTPLPVNPNPIFSSTTASNLDLNSAYKNYFPFCNAYNFQAIKAGGSDSITTNILLSQTNVYFDWLYNGTTSNIFSINNTNTTGSGLSNFFYTASQVNNAGGAILTTSTYTFINTLYSNLATAITDTSVASGGLRVSLTGLRDAYTSGTATGFYMRAYPNIRLASLSGTVNSIYYQLTNPTTTLTSGIFNVDIAGSNTSAIISVIADPAQLAGAPATYSNYVCGVLLFTSGAPYNMWIQASNLGSYYIRSNAVAVSLQSNSSVSLCNFPFSVVTTPFYSSCNVASSYTTAPLSNSTYFIWTTQISYPIYTPCNAPTFRGAACNLYGTGPTNNYSFVSGTLANQRPIFFDTPSIIVRNATLGQGIYGARVESGSSSNPGIGAFGSNFNDTLHLIGTYSNEIQLTNGSYRTYCNARLNGSLNGYLDYTSYYNPYGAPAYSNYGTVVQSGMRYLTLKWSYAAGTNDWKSALINFTFGDSNSMFPSDVGSIVFSGITIQMRIVASDDSSALPGNFTTAWLNANAITSSAPNNITKNNYGTPVGFNYAGAQTDNCNIRVFYPSFGSSYSNINHSVYLRFGFPMNSNISLQYVSYTAQVTNSIPQAATGLTISNSAISAALLCNTLVSWSRQNDGIDVSLFLGTYRAISNTVGGQLYPRRFGGTVVADTDTFTVAGGGGYDYTTTFIPTNYDTYYSATIQTSNISGVGPIASNTSINSTALPPLIGDGFSGVLRTATPVNYSQNGFLFTNRGGDSINSNDIYNYNFLMPSGTSSNFNVYSAGGGLSRIILNSNSVGNISNITWNVNLYRNEVSAVNSNYTFRNSNFGLSNTNISVTTSGGLSWGYNYISDMYFGGVYTSRFYILAQPYISFTNTIVRAGSSNYKLVITDTTAGISNLVNFYVDNLNTSPSGRIFVENIGGITYCNICGVPVITSTSFNFWIQTSNIGSNFIVATPVSVALTNGGTFTFNRVTTSFYSSSNVGSVYTSGPISNVSFFYWQNVNVTNRVFESTYTLSGTATNLIGSATLGGGNGFTPYYDPLSIATLACNVRVVSGGDTISPTTAGYNPYPTVGAFGNIFDNTISLAGNNELQLVNGNYVTKASIGALGYRHYSDSYFNPFGATQYDYTTIIATDSKMRYVSFLFSNINPSGGPSNKIDTLTLKLYYKTIPTTSGGYYDTSAIFQVRINSNIATTSNNSSGWLNANSGLSGSISINNKINDGQSCITTIPTNTGGTDPIETRTIKIPDGCGYSNMNLYTRLGLNMLYPYSIQRIQIDTQTTINIPNEFNATLYVNCNLGQRQQFYINLLPCLPIATYCNLSASFSNTSLATVNMTPAPITHLSNYSFTTNTDYTNISNVWTYGTFNIRTNNGTTFYTSNAIQSIDYFVAQPVSAVISFSNTSGGGSPAIWSNSNNYLILTISHIANLTSGQIYYTFSNNTRSVNIESNRNITEGAAGTFTISNALTSNDYRNRAFYVSCYTSASMRDASLRTSGTLIGAQAGIFSPPSGFSVTTSASGTNGVSQYSYTSQLFTFSNISATYSNVTYSAGGFPRRVGGYVAGAIDSATSNPFPTFPFTRTSPFNVYDTNYNANLFLTYNDGGPINTALVTATSRTALPSDTRIAWTGSLIPSGISFPNLGYVASVGAVTVLSNGSASNIFTRNSISVNSSPGTVAGKTLTISDQAGSFSYSFIDNSYTYTNTNKSNLSLLSGNRSGTLSTYDAISGTTNPARLNESGFYMAFDLQYRYLYTPSTNPIITTLTFDSIPITNTVYVDSDPGQISLGTFSPNYTFTSITNNLIGATAISVQSLLNGNLNIVNTFVNIKPFNFGRTILTYTGGGAPTNTPYSWSFVTSRNMSLLINLFGGIPTNTITNYNIEMSFSNIKTSASTNFSDAFFNDNTITTANSAITACNVALGNPTPKWILGAWRADINTLPFTLTELRSTYGNSTFQIGPGVISYRRSVEDNTENIFFTITTNVANRGFTSITAFYPPGPNGTGGTFNCLVTTGGLSELDTSGGCLLNNPSSNNYEIACPYQFRGGNVTITISLGATQNISNIN